MPGGNLIGLSQKMPNASHTAHPLHGTTETLSVQSKLALEQALVPPIRLDCMVKPYILSGKSTTCNCMLACMHIQMLHHTAQACYCTYSLSCLHW